MYISLSLVTFHHHWIHVEKIQRVYRCRVVIDWSMSIYVYYILLYLDGIWAQWIGAVHPWPRRDFCRTQVSKCIDDACHFKHPGNHCRVRFGQKIHWNQELARIGHTAVQGNSTCWNGKSHVWFWGVRARHHHSILATCHITFRGMGSFWEVYLWLQRWTSRNFVWHRMAWVL